MRKQTMKMLAHLVSNSRNNNLKKQFIRTLVINEEMGKKNQCIYKRIKR